MKHLVLPSAAAIVLLGFSAANAESPVGRADFVIDSANVSSALGARRAEVVAELAKFMAERAEQHFGFVDWSATTTNSRFALTARLVDEDTGNCAPTTRLRLDGSFGNPIPVSNPALLYDGCDPVQPYLDDPAQFTRDVKAAIDRIIDEPVRRSVLTGLLAKISLAATLVVDHEQMSVFLPMRPDELKAADDSMLTVQFESQGTNGQLRLKPFGQPIMGRILCRVSDYVVPPPVNIVGPTEAFFWHDSFERIFPKDRMPRISVFMTSYVPDPFAGQTGISNGVVTTGP